MTPPIRLTVNQFAKKWPEFFYDDGEINLSAINDVLSVACAAAFGTHEDRLKHVFGESYKDSV